MATRAAVSVALATLLWMASAPPQAPVPTTEPVAPDISARLGVLERRARLLVESANEVEARYWRDVEPIERALLFRARNPGLARLAAWAVVREAESRHLPPELLAAVMQVENPWLVQDTVSFAGAVGWMQVMPFHAEDGGHPCGSDLTDGPTSVCYGADILRKYLGAALDEAIQRALLRYNGCMSAPGCEMYADRVLARMQ